MTRCFRMYIKICILCWCITPLFLYAQGTSGVSVDINISPRTGTFFEGGTFDVPVSINTNGESVKKIKVVVTYDKDKIAIVSPSSGTSVIGVWTEAPSYNNGAGILTYEGEVPGGLVVQGGLIGVITFKALSTGDAHIRIDTDSKVVTFGPIESSPSIAFGRGDYTILKKVSEGVVVFSETHGFENKWYNNNNPVFAWQVDPDTQGYSFALDNKPFTIPDNAVDDPGSSKGYENVSNGLWYFHIKSVKHGVWGSTGHFLVRIDTEPPRPFTPQIKSSLAGALLSNRTLVSFVTTDALSGIDHYEVGVVDKNKADTESPVFIQTESPFQVPSLGAEGVKVIVRAVDKAGNIQEGFIDVQQKQSVSQFADQYFKLIIIVCMLLGVIYFIMKYNKIGYFKSRTFEVIDKDLKQYLDEAQELNRISNLEKEKIESIKQDLEEVQKEFVKNNDNQHSV